MLEAWTDFRERQRRDVLREDDAVGIAHRHAGHPVGAPGHLERSLDHLAVGVDGDLAAVPHRSAHVDGDAGDAATGELGLDGLHPRVGLDAQRVGADQPAVVDELREAADAVAAHLGPTAVGIVDDHPAIPTIGGRQEQDDAVGADAAAAIAEPRRQRGGVAGEPLAGVDVDEVVRRALQLREAQRRHVSGAPEGYARRGPDPRASRVPLQCGGANRQSGRPRDAAARCSSTPSRNRTRPRS